MSVTSFWKWRFREGQQHAQGHTVSHGRVHLDPQTMDSHSSFGTVQMWVWPTKPLQRPTPPCCLALAWGSPWGQTYPEVRCGYACPVVSCRKPWKPRSKAAVEAEGSKASSEQQRQDPHPVKVTYLSTPQRSQTAPGTLPEAAGTKETRSVGFRGRQPGWHSSSPHNCCVTLGEVSQHL